MTSTDFKKKYPNLEPSWFHLDGVPCFDKMDNEFLTKLNLCLSIPALGYYITSSFRDKEKNTAVGGAAQSLHLSGRAIDLVLNSDFYTLKGRNNFASFFHSLGSVGLSVFCYETHYHIGFYPNHCFFRKQ